MLTKEEVLFQNLIQVEVNWIPGFFLFQNSLFTFCIKVEISFQT